MGKVEIAGFFSLLLLAVFFGWGLYLLHIRLNRQSDINPAVEAATLAALVVFFAFEFALLGVWLERNPVLRGFSTLGLAVAGCALYGPMILSMVSHALVGVLLPSGPDAAAVPHFGAAEQYERGNDFENALKAYHAQYAAFPGDSAIALRIADVLEKLERREEAVEWFRRGIDGIHDPEQALLTTNRVVEIALRHLNRRDIAISVLEQHILRFKKADTAPIAERRLRRVMAGGGLTGHDIRPSAPPIDEGLLPLERDAGADETPKDPGTFQELD